MGTPPLPDGPAGAGRRAGTPPRAAGASTPVALDIYTRMWPGDVAKCILYDTNKTRT